MAVYALKMSDTTNEVYQVETDVEITIPAQIDYETFEGAIGFNIKSTGDEDSFDFTLTPSGMEVLIKFWNDHKDNIR